MTAKKETTFCQKIKKKTYLSFYSKYVFFVNDSYWYKECVSKINYHPRGLTTHIYEWVMIHELKFLNRKVLLFIKTSHEQRLRNFKPKMFTKNQMRLIDKFLTVKNLLLKFFMKDFSFFLLDQRKFNENVYIKRESFYGNRI